MALLSVRSLRFPIMMVGVVRGRYSGSAAPPARRRGFGIPDAFARWPSGSEHPPGSRSAFDQSGPLPGGIFFIRPSGEHGRSSVLPYLRISDYKPAAEGTCGGGSDFTAEVLYAARDPDFSGVLRLCRHCGAARVDRADSAAARRHAACADLHDELPPRTLLVRESSVVAFGGRAVLSALARRC